MMVYRLAKGKYADDLVLKIVGKSPFSFDERLFVR